MLVSYNKLVKGLNYYGVSYVTIIEKNKNVEGELYITVVNPHLSEAYKEEFDIYIKDKSTWNLLKEDIMYIASYTKKFKNSPYILREIDYISSIKSNNKEELQ
ncbi:hypothetical protein BTS2_2680 [Bacillus sp. TS-2]|nr:hypothetical protein BTS2_2680 [Bacillus sp. TS-2]